MPSERALTIVTFYERLQFNAVTFNLSFLYPMFSRSLMFILRQGYFSVLTVIVEPSKFKNSAWNGSSSDTGERSKVSHLSATAVRISPYLVLLKNYDVPKIGFPNASASNLEPDVAHNTFVVQDMHYMMPRCLQPVGEILSELFLRFFIGHVPAKETSLLHVTHSRFYGISPVFRKFVLL